MEKIDIRKIIFIGIGVIVILFVLMIFGIIPGLKKSNTPTIQGQLKIWVLEDGSQTSEAAFRGILNQFKKNYPGIKIDERIFSNKEDYQNALSRSFGSGETPDVFLIENNTLHYYINKLVPVPSSIYSIESLRNQFPKIVEKDFTEKGKLYGLPISIDTLALIFNRSLIDQAAIEIPKSWEEFENAVQKITKNNASSISLAGAAMGGSQVNIPTAPDIVSLLMLQKNSPMIDANFTRALFSGEEASNALSFYTRFADRSSLDYTWNETLPNMYDLFAQEKVAMIIDYQKAIPQLKEKNAFLDIGISEAPSFDNQIQENHKLAYARYFGFVVSRESKNPNIAWLFISSITTKETYIKKYLTETKKPPALRTLINISKNDPDIGVFSRQALIATSWPQVDSSFVENVFSKMIQYVIRNEKKSEEAVNEAAYEISRQMEKTSQ